MFGVETVRVWCEEGKYWIKIVGPKLKSKSSDSKSIDYLTQLISLPIQLRNAERIVYTFLLPFRIEIRRLNYLQYYIIKKIGLEKGLDFIFM